MSCRRSLRSLRQDELSLPGATQPIDCPLVLDFHHGAGREQFAAGNPLHSGLGRNAGCGNPGRSGVGKRLRIQSRVDGPVHVRVVEAGIPASVPPSSGTRAYSGRCLPIVASTQFHETDDVRNFITKIVMRIILILKGRHCQPQIATFDAMCFQPWGGTARCDSANSRRRRFRVLDFAPHPRLKNRSNAGQSEFRNTRSASRSDFASD